MDNFKSELHNEIMQEYNATRAKNETAYKNIKKQIYSHQPRIREIDDELTGLSLKACKMVLNSGLDHNEIIEKMKSDTERLIKEKNRILVAAGLPLNCMDEIFTCPKCKDRGIVDNQRCECYYEKLQRLMQKKSNISPNNSNCFENYKTDLFSALPSPEFGLSPRENARDIYNLAKKYASFDKSISNQLLFYGGPGLGKTFTSDCIAREFIKNGKDVYYTSAPQLFSIFEDYKFGRNTTGETKQLIDYISTVDLLIIDDLGTEFRTQYIDSILFDIINSRISLDKHIIISTNLSPSTLETTYSQRISSRILGSFDIVLFIGDDLRLKKDI